MISQANNSAGRLAAVAVSSAPEAKSSISPWNRAADRCILPAEKTSTSVVTAVIIGTVKAANGSMAKAKSAPSING